MYKLSPSSLNLFKECPRCFWLKLHKKWSRPAGPFPSLPSGMDRVLKEHFDSFMTQGKLPPELCENSVCKGLKLFSDKDKLKVWRNNFKGVSWTNRAGHILRGAVDNILVKGKKLIVLDYKTRGYPLKETTASHYQLQMDLYNFLLRKNKYSTEDYAYLLFYYPRLVTPTGEVVFDTSLVKMNTKASRGERVFKSALKVLEGECPKKRCAWCVGVKSL